MHRSELILKFFHKALNDLTRLSTAFLFKCSLCLCHTTYKVLRMLRCSRYTTLWSLAVIVVCDTTWRISDGGSHTRETWRGTDNIWAVCALITRKRLPALWFTKDNTVTNTEKGLCECILIESIGYYCPPHHANKCMACLRLNQIFSPH